MTFLPIADRELRVAARRKATHWFRFCAAAAVIGFGFMVLASARSSMQAHQIGRMMFGWESAIVFGLCLFAGVFLTADCLSYERREGTLGLLFLADLKGYDVVLGKLASSSLQCFFGVLATFPMLGLPLLMGGTTGGEFGRLILVLATTMAWSLCLGMAVSAICREARQAVVLTFGLVILLAGIPPMLNMLGRWMWGWTTKADLVLVLSPVGALMRLNEAFINSSRHALFWWSIALLWAMSAVALLFASVILPGQVRERSKSAGSESRASTWRWVRFRWRLPAGRRWIDYNPFYWLTGRDRLGLLQAWPVVLLVGAVWAGFFLSSVLDPRRNRSDDTLGVSFFVAYALHLVFKAIVAMEATRRLHEDRQSGALELLLVTPLSPRRIAQGQWMALWRQFAWPLLVVLSVNLVLFSYLISNRSPFSNDDEKVMFGILIVGGAILLLLDFFALSWVGMIRGLRHRRYHFAILATLWPVMLPTIGGVLFMFLLAIGGTGISQDEMQGMLILWVILSVFYGAVLGAVSYAHLLQNFRKLASGERITSAHEIPASRVADWQRAATTGPRVS